MNVTNVNVRDGNSGAQNREVTGDEFGGTNAPNVHNGEVGDDKIEDLDSRKEMADEVDKKTRNTTVVIYVHNGKIAVEQILTVRILKMVKSKTKVNV